MKECTSCQKKFDDQLTFCPSCGTQLALAQNPAPQAPSAAPKAWEPWMPLIMGVGGLIVTWYIWDLLGGALSIIGGILGWKSKNSFIKWASLLFAVLNGVLTLWSLFQ